MKGIASSCQGFSDCNFGALLGLAGNILHWFVIISVPIAAAIIAYAGITMALTPTSPDKHSEAKKILWSAVIGLVIILGSVIMVKTLIDALASTEQKDKINQSLGF